MIRTHILLASVAAVALSSCYVTPVPAGPPGHRGPHSRYDRDRYDRDRHDHDRDGDRDRHDRYDRDRDGRDRYDGDRRGPSYSSRDPRSPFSPGGSVVLPREARRVSYRGNTYYTHRNVWYRPSGSSYVVVASPY